MTTHREPRRAGLPAAPADDSWASAGAVHEDLRAAKTSVYDPAGLACSRPVAEAESAEYAAYEFTVDGRAVRFRAAKTTPTKVGQFVTVWKRSEGGPIRPFDAADPVDLFVVSTRDVNTRDVSARGVSAGSRACGHFGQFVFSRQALRTRDIVSSDGSGGKRGFRVYPPWSTTTNRQARSTQAWQSEYFLRLDEGRPLDVTRARALYHA
jgi:hypothetical protein